MALLNLLTISILLLFHGPHVPGDKPACTEIKASIEIRNTTSQNDGSLIITIEGNPRDFRLFLIAPKKSDNRMDLPVQEIKNLPAGDYEVVITEAKEGDYCPKRIKVAIK